MILAGDRSQSNPSRPGGARAGSPANVHCEVQARVLAAYEASSWPLQSCTNAHALPEGYRFWAHATYRDYEPSPAQWVRDQVELYESSGGTEGTTLRGMPVVVITSRGAKSGTLRKNPVMRVEHDGRYAAVASKGGAPEHPTWYHNLLACLLYTSDAADEEDSVDLGGRRIITKKKT